MTTQRFTTCWKCRDRHDTENPRITGIAVGGQINPDGDPS